MDPSTSPSTSPPPTHPNPPPPAPTFSSQPKNLAAWALQPKSRPLVVGSAPYTPPPPDHVVIRVVDVAINPIDWIIQEQDIFGMKFPTPLGCDLSGEVVERGVGVEGELGVGTRVVAHAVGMTKDPTCAAFQKYVVVPKTAVAELPYAIRTVEGVVLPLSISTAAAGLYQQGFLALPYPTTEKQNRKPLNRTLLIWGGSSSVGSSAIQLAVASGAEVVTTCSPRNFEYVRGLGATHAFDYRDEGVEEKVVMALKGKTVSGAFHAVGGDGAVQTAARIVDRCTGKAIVVTVRGVPETGVPGSVRVNAIASGAIFGNEVGPYIWRKFLPRALEKGVVKPAPQPLTVGEELRSVQLGLDRQKKGVSARKVVVTNISSGT